MSENPHHLESLLAGLRPAAPDPELQERVKADLRLDDAWLPRQMRRAPRWLAATGWAGLGAAAALVALSLVPPGNRATPANTPSIAQSTPSLESMPDLISPSLPAGLVWSWEKQEWVNAPQHAGAPLPVPQSGLLVPQSGLLPVNF